MIRVNILVCSNAGFFQHSAVMLTSLLTSNPGVGFDIVVVTGDSDAPECRKLERSIAQFGNAALRVHPFSPSTSLGLYTPGRYTVDNYTRLWVADFFPNDVDRVLYLDSDMVVLGDILELWQTDLGGKLLGAVDIPGSIRCDELDMPANHGYFNSGVMLIDLAQWRATNALDKVLGAIRWYGSKLRDVDQDALNASLYADRMPLPYKWNVMMVFFHAFHDLRLPAAEIQAVKREARIVHFNGEPRPWSYYSRHPFKPNYYANLARTEWRGTQPRDRTPQDAFRKHVGPLLPSFLKRSLLKLLG